MSEHQVRAYWVREPGVGELRDEVLPPAPGPGMSLVEATVSGISPGTERLVGLARVPAACRDHMACRYMDGDFALPIKYGYTLVGRGLAGKLDGRRVFVMHPHQSIVEIRDEDATMLPDDIPDQRALLIPNMETAINAVWDAELTGDERIVVIGAGIVGLLVAFAARRLHDRPVTVIDRDAGRLRSAAACPWVDTVTDGSGTPDAWIGHFDVAFHATGAPAALQVALDAVGVEGRVVDLSWYGDQKVVLDLGAAFHYQRKRIISSQVAMIARAKRDTTSYRDRLDRVIELLSEPELDRLLGNPIPFEALPAFMRTVYDGASECHLPVIEFAGASRA